MMIPVFERLADARRILVAGCGGGFDVFAGLPLAHYLRAAGKEVVFANLSFTNLWLCGGERVTPSMWRVDQVAADLPYFPEKWLHEWLAQRGEMAPIYAFAKSGVRPLAEAYRLLIERYEPDLILLVDGGTDSIVFGDEPGLGTPVEDAASIVAACLAGGERVVLAAIGFGIDHYHGISHHAFLENTAQLMRDGGFLGVFSPTADSTEAAAFLDLVDYANRRQPQHQSIVCNSIANALRGEFGDYHATNRTSGGELFINPLMTQYWCFSAPHILARMVYGAELAETESADDVRRVIEATREFIDIRQRQPIPL
jgi:hypothetical protein